MEEVGEDKTRAVITEIIRIEIMAVRTTNIKSVISE
jgi:hypothetical protein